MLNKLIIITSCIIIYTPTASAVGTIKCEQICTADACGQPAVAEQCRKNCRGSYMRACVAAAGSKQKAPVEEVDPVGISAMMVEGNEDEAVAQEEANTEQENAEGGGNVEAPLATEERSEGLASRIQILEQDVAVIKSMLASRGRPEPSQAHKAGMRPPAPIPEMHQQAQKPLQKVISGQPRLMNHTGAQSTPPPQQAARAFQSSDNTDNNEDKGDKFSKFDKIASKLTSKLSGSDKSGEQPNLERVLDSFKF